MNMRQVALLTVFIYLVFFSLHVFASDPGTPFTPSQNIQDPGAPGTPGGGCGPTDPNCYVTVSSSQWTTAGSDIYYSGGNVGIGDSSPLAAFTVGSGDLFQVNSAGAIAAITGYTQGSGTMSLTSANTNQLTTSSIFALNGNSLTSGTGMYIASSTLTGGTLLSLVATNGTSASGQSGINVAISGAISGGSTSAGVFTNSHSGVTINYGVQSTVSGSTNTSAAFKATATGSGNVNGVWTSAGASPPAVVSGTYAVQASVGATGTALFGYSNGGGTPLLLRNETSDTNGLLALADFRRTTSGTAADGIGGYMYFETEADDGVNYLSNQLVSKWITAANATRTSQFIITGVNSAVLADLFTLSGSGALKLNKYGVGTFTGTPAYTLQVDSSGNIIESTVGSSDLNGLSDCVTDYATDFNMFCGSGAGASIAVGGQRNLAFGQSALNAVTTADENLAIGYNALTLNTASNNLAIGANALNANTTGTPNLAIGFSALGANQTGTHNVAIGYQALLSNTVNYNFAIGPNALRANTTGSGNLGMGYFALDANQTGANNLAIGASALQLNTVSNNLAIGANALNSNTTGTPNLAIGRSALSANQTGNSSIAIGDGALLLSTGGTNIAIGHSAGDSITTGTGNVLIGNSIDTSAVGANNELNIAGVIFSDNIPTGEIGIGDTTPDYLLDVENTGTDGYIFALHDSDGECLHDPEAGAETVTCSSDERLKTNIVDSSPVLDYLNSFRIRNYDVIASGNNMTGVIAQEVLLTHPELVSLLPSGMYSVQLPNQWKLVKGIQELDIKLQDISDFENDGNSFGDKLRAWLANSTNKITRIFTGEICLTDAGEDAVCINRSELQSLKGLLNQSSSGAPSPEITEPDSTVPEVVEPPVDPVVEIPTETPPIEEPVEPITP